MSKVKEYISETYNEMVHNVTWPTWKELQSNSIVVVVASIIIALIIKLMDFSVGINAGSFWDGVLGLIYGL